MTSPAQCAFRPLAALAIAACLATPALSLDGIDRFETTYRVTWSGIELGNFTAATQFNGNRYSIRGNGQFALLEGLLFNWKGTTTTAGSIGEDGGPVPSDFVFDYKSGRKGERLRIDYDGADVTGVEIVPAWTPDADVVPVRKAQLARSLDPLSAVFLLGRTKGGKSEASLCQRTIPVFDGRMRYDLVLSHRKTVQVKNEGTARYTGPVVVCRVKYVPISGHKRDDAGTVHLAKSPDIEVWLVPLPNASLHVPYAIHMPTLGGGYASVTATKFSASPGPRRSAFEASRNAR